MEHQALEALKSSPVPQLPEHHVQWFNAMKEAAKNDDLALISCRDAATGESRSVIALVAYGPNGEFGFTPLGHMATTDNPFDSYIPPEAEPGRLQ